MKDSSTPQDTSGCCADFHFAIIPPDVGVSRFQRFWSYSGIVLSISGTYPSRQLGYSVPGHVSNVHLPHFSIWTELHRPQAHVVELAPPTGGAKAPNPKGTAPSQAPPPRVLHSVPEGSPADGGISVSKLVEKDVAAQFSKGKCVFPYGDATFMEAKLLWKRLQAEDGGG
ncbi:hypothetical protein PI124_g768 [Phytophthora idaei]|nr:hypothetical protein PI125_g16635 [Phytophthora idaei]KAG3165841.1 hypothetical protein PI126_g4437 [Phytophthora idaei]KAG3254706.1 hypothetical protein PI124_g768 [Phytophthora idaei]